MMRNKYTGSEEATDYTVYETKEEAEYALQEAKNDYETGADVLEEAGEDYEDSNNMEFWIQEV